LQKNKDILEEISKLKSLTINYPEYEGFESRLNDIKSMKYTINFEEESIINGIIDYEFSTKDFDTKKLARIEEYIKKAIDPSKDFIINYAQYKMFSSVLLMELAGFTAKDENLLASNMNNRKAGLTTLVQEND